MHILLRRMLFERQRAPRPNEQPAMRMPKAKATWDKQRVMTINLSSRSLVHSLGWMAARCQFDQGA